MLSCSLDPDQDLQSGSKLVTWYDVCCNIRGGGLCPSCKIQWGGLCPSCKIQRGGLCPSCKIHGGDFVHVYKNEQGGFVRGGFCPTLFFFSLNKIIYSLKGNSRRLSYLTLSLLAASHLYLHCLLKLVCD